jgi:hypothetical protein
MAQIRQLRRQRFGIERVCLGGVCTSHHTSSSCHPTAVCVAVFWGQLWTNELLLFSRYLVIPLKFWSRWWNALPQPTVCYTVGSSSWPTTHGKASMYSERTAPDGPPSTCIHHITGDCNDWRRLGDCGAWTSPRSGQVCAPPSLAASTRAWPQRSDTRQPPRTPRGPLACLRASAQLGHRDDLTGWRAPAVGAFAAASAFNMMLTSLTRRLGIQGVIDCEEAWISQQMQAEPEKETLRLSHHGDVLSRVPMEFDTCACQS